MAIVSHGDDVLTEVLNALYWDLAVPQHRVRVEVINGWVTLSGVVDRPYQRNCAESDARRVPGVVGVANQIRLAPTPADGDYMAAYGGGIALMGPAGAANELPQLASLEPVHGDDRW